MFDKLFHHHKQDSSSCNTPQSGSTPARRESVDEDRRQARLHKEADKDRHLAEDKDRLAAFEREVENDPAKARYGLIEHSGAGRTVGRSHSR